MEAVGARGTMYTVYTSIICSDLKERKTPTANGGALLDLMLLHNPADSSLDRKLASQR